MEHVKGFLPRNYFDEGIVAEAAELGLLKNSDKPRTQWLSSDDRDYCFSDNKRNIHAPKDINRYPAICKLMELVNNDPRTTQNAHSALIIVYNYSKYAGIDFHNDGETLIDSESSISTISFGATRKIDFCRRAKRPHVDEFSYEAAHHDLMIMKPGCQNHLVHRVCLGTAGQKTGDWRIVISFRKTTPPVDSTPDPEISFDNLDTAAKEEVIKSHLPDNKTPIKKTCLIAGNSFSSALDAKRLGRRGRKEVINLSNSGAKIEDVIDQLDKYFLSTEYNNVTVDKVFICVGANDIRNCRENGVRHLKSPLVQLSQKIKMLFPEADVWFQSLIPLTLQHQYSVRNVEQFNGLLYEVCKFTKNFFLDVFQRFLEYDYFSESFYRDESLFLNNPNIHLNKRGLGILAKSYLKLIHSNQFNPLGY